MATIRDIERKRAEVYLAAIVEGSDYAIIGETLDGSIVSWNKSAEKVYGYKAEGVLGHSIAIRLPPGKPDELPWILKKLRRGQRIESYETTRVHKDGHLIDVSITISPVKDKGDRHVQARPATVQDLVTVRLAEKGQLAWKPNV